MFALKNQAFLRYYSTKTMSSVELTVCSYNTWRKKEKIVGEKNTMAQAFVLVNTEIGSESEVLMALKKVDGVQEAYSVYGVYDLVAKIEAETMDKLKQIVTWHIRRLDKVRSTLTMIVIEEPQASDLSD